VELTILMPCLNEAETLAVCIEKAHLFIKQHNIDAEVVIADNGSTDVFPPHSSKALKLSVPH
jgi:glycosyltransferase involved in cell wall biosynthesis